MSTKNEYFLWIAESHHLIDIVFSREIEYRKLQACWDNLATKQMGFELLQKQEKQTDSHVYNLRCEFDANVNYIEGVADHSAKEISIRVAKDWIEDMQLFWTTIHSDDDPYSNHQFQLKSKKGETRGSRKRGFTIQVEYLTRQTIGASYECREIS